MDAIAQDTIKKKDTMSLSLKRPFIEDSNRSARQESSYRPNRNFDKDVEEVKEKVKSLEALYEDLPDESKNFKVLVTKNPSTPVMESSNTTKFSGIVDTETDLVIISLILYGAYSF